MMIDAIDRDGTAIDDDDDDRAIGQARDLPLANAVRFLTAGKAIFTLVGTSGRYTYRINRKDPEVGSQYTQPAYFVSLLTGPDNTTEYTYLGMLQPATGEIKLTRNSRYTDDTVPVKAVRWAFRILWAGRTLPAPARILHAGRCGRCGRLLTVPTSIDSGFGPECIGKI